MDNSLLAVRDINHIYIVVDKELHECRERSGLGPALLGSLNKEFPSTMAVIVADEKSREAVFYWCGDSRGYVLDRQGLHQVTTDDVTVTDAMENLREDAPLTNVVCASHPYEIHKRHVHMDQPAILLTATDGCFGYLPSPMEFEKLLLETLEKAADLEEWREALRTGIGDVAGDDYTMGIWPCGFRDFYEMQESMKKRLLYMRRKYPLDTGAGEQELFRQWAAYRKTYESLQGTEVRQA